MEAMEEPGVAKGRMRSRMLRNTGLDGSGCHTIYQHYTITSTKSYIIFCFTPISIYTSLWSTYVLGTSTISIESTWAEEDDYQR